MAQDQQTFHRAANAALVGLLTQLGLAILVALVGLYMRAPAAHAAAWHLFGGLPIWLILWVLFHQHRLERAEALEAEQLARTDARAAALFDEAGEQLALARKRLETINKWWIPAVSLGVSAYLIVVGGLLTWLNYRAGDALRRSPIGEAALGNLEVVTVVLIVVGFVAFLVARYVAGMTQVREWTQLRGGASYLMGVVVIAALLVAGAVAAYFDNLAVLAALALVVPALMVLLGLEMLLGFTFGLYRPRRPGEIHRPAFDSRVLGWLSRPESLGKIINETINYQFGFEISRSWFYRLLAKAITPLVVVALVVLVGLTSLVIVAPQQQAVITRFGALHRVVAEPGLTFKLPWPIERAEKYEVYRVHQVTVGADDYDLKPGVPILWTNQHAESTEEYLVTAPTRYRGAGEVDAETGAVAGELIGTRAVVKYRVADLADYVTAAQDPADLLKTIATRRVNAYFVTHDVDTLLTQGRMELGEELRQAIQADVERFGRSGRPLGLEVVFVGFETMHPPQDSEVAAKFHEQVDARQEKASAIQDAEKGAVTTLAEVAGTQEMALRIDAAIAELERLRARLSQARAAGGDVAAVQEAIAQQEVEIERLMDEAGGRAAQMIYDARAYRWEHALGERARAMRMASLYEAYRQAPEYFRKRTFLETVAEGIRDRRKTVIAGDAAGTRDIRLNLETEGADLGSAVTNLE